MLDADRGREPASSRGEVRLRNLVQPEQMPFDNITKKHFDSGDYPEAMRRALAAIDVDGVRARQRTGEPDGRGSASASRSIASRRRTARRSIPAGAFRWCPATSRPSRA